MGRKGSLKRVPTNNIWLENEYALYKVLYGIKTLTKQKAVMKI